MDDALIECVGLDETMRACVGLPIEPDPEGAASDVAAMPDDTVRVLFAFLFGVFVALNRTGLDSANYQRFRAAALDGRTDTLRDAIRFEREPISGER